MLLYLMLFKIVGMGLKLLADRVMLPLYGFRIRFIYAEEFTNPLIYILYQRILYGP